MLLYMQKECGFIRTDYFNLSTLDRPFLCGTDSFDKSW